MVGAMAKALAAGHGPNPAVPLGLPGVGIRRVPRLARCAASRRDGGLAVRLTPGQTGLFQISGAPL